MHHFGSQVGVYFPGDFFPWVFFAYLVLCGGFFQNRNKTFSKSK